MLGIDAFEFFGRVKSVVQFRVREQFRGTDTSLFVTLDVRSVRLSSRLKVLEKDLDDDAELEDESESELELELDLRERFDLLCLAMLAMLEQKKI
ncbi:hypothetical protein OUZ56_018587 [Daphnia magna]|uniref:Uncharacterized protein n=1 Tax=Daphnia magna TaxID=35525 RepID=A0ABQ9ZAE3_9CRUS|nr:hypothetical protein OUZ56_018587 [Daphnia magna]